MNEQKDVERGERRASASEQNPPPLRDSSRALSFGQNPGRADAIKIAKRFIDECKQRGEMEWAQVLQSRLNVFQMIKSHALLELVIYAVEYHSALPPASSVNSRSKDIRNFKELLDYLGQTPESSLQAQVLFIVQSRSISDDTMTFFESAHALFDERGSFSHAISAMLYMTIASKWSVDNQHLKGVLDIESNPAAVPTGLEMQLPSSIEVPSDQTEDYLQHVPILAQPFFYENDNTVHTKRPHRRPPKIDMHKVLYTPAKGSTTYSRLINSILYANKSEDGYPDIPSQFGILDHLREHASALAPRYTLGAIARKALSKHCGFLGNIQQLAAKLEYDGRLHPSTAKIDWLQYALDCTKMIDNVAEHSKDFPMSWPADDKWEEWKQSYNKDRQYVSNAAKEIKKEVERVRNHLKETLEISMSGRTTLLTILAALYVPLSFTTGIFGMNIGEINNATPKYFHVLAVAIPLTVVTVLVPLNFGPLWRNSLRVSVSLEDGARKPSGRVILVVLESFFASLTILFFVLANTGPIQFGAVYLYPTCLTIWATCSWFASWSRGENRFWARLLTVLIVIANWILAWAYLDFNFAPGASPNPELASPTSITVISTIGVLAPFVIRLLSLIVKFFRRNCTVDTQHSMMLGLYIAQTGLMSPVGYQIQ